MDCEPIESQNVYNIFLIKQGTSSLFGTAHTHSSFNSPTLFLIQTYCLTQFYSVIFFPSINNVLRSLLSLKLFPPPKLTSNSPPAPGSGFIDQIYQTNLTASCLNQIRQVISTWCYTLLQRSVTCTRHVSIRIKWLRFPRFR